jgi:radical SAM protein with 4Fe4S-binding SPASM domain
VRDDHLLENLIKSGIDKIIVSCDGASRETYEKYRIGGDFDLVMKNLRFLADKNKDSGNKTDILWNFLVFKHNEHETGLIEKIASDIGVNFSLGLMRTSLKDEVIKPHKEAIKQDEGWIPDNPEYSAYDKVNCIPKRALKSCRKPWDSIAINWEGLVFSCCAVYEEKYNFGDAKKDPIAAIWNNPMFIRARSEILNRKLPANTTCGRCRDNGFMHM